MMNENQSVLGLATIRRNRGITLQQISAATKIGVRSLEAIESGDFRVLPGGIYATSYIRQYARAIDYPEDDILELYRRHMASPAAPSRPARGTDVPDGLRAASTTVGS
jgi:cytoskeletal protein RodZ